MITATFWSRLCKCKLFYFCLFFFSIDMHIFATGYIRMEKLFEVIFFNYLWCSAAPCTLTMSVCVFGLSVGGVFTCVLTPHSEPLSSSSSPHVSSRWLLYVMPTEPTTVLSDLNTDCKLVFSLALAMTFTSMCPWRLAWISYLSHLASLKCVWVWACTYVRALYSWIEMSMDQCVFADMSVSWEVCWPKDESEAPCFKGICIWKWDCWMWEFCPSFHFSRWIISSHILWAGAGW